MKGLKLVLIGLFFTIVLCTVNKVNAQCAMCTTTVETNKASGDKTANGLNNGILFLLSAPYLAVGVVGFIWYKRYRRKNINLQMRNEKLHLN